MKRTIESKQKISDALRGMIHSEQSRKNMSLAHIGLKQTDETVNKRVSKTKGMKRTEETRKNMSEARKNWWLMKKKLEVMK